MKLNAPELNTEGKRKRKDKISYAMRYLLPQEKLDHPPRDERQAPYNAG